MLCTEEIVRSNIRNRDGKRVFFLGENDTLTPGARDFLTRQRISILPASQAAITEYRLPCGGILTDKPEHMTHLHSNVLVPKTHPRIAFRGAMDTLEAELLLCQAEAEAPVNAQIGEILALARGLIRCEVMEEPVRLTGLCGLSDAELRSHSHHPEKYYGHPHFMPDASDSPLLLKLNRCRCACRAAELAAAGAFTTTDGLCARTDLLQAINRMSSMLYILMIRQKAKNSPSK